MWDKISTKNKGGKTKQPNDILKEKLVVGYGEREESTRVWGNVSQLMISALC